MDEAELIRNAIGGDQDAFSALYSAHHARVFNLLFQRTKNREDAEDLSEIAFASAFSALPRFGGHSKFSTWLHRIAVNHFLMTLRRRDRPEMRSLDELGFDEGESVTRVRDAALESFPVRDALARSIAQLPAGQRQVLLMRAEGYTHAEISEALGCSVANSKSQYHRARVLVRTFLAARRQPPLESAAPIRALCQSLVGGDVTAPGSAPSAPKMRRLPRSHLTRVAALESHPVLQKIEGYIKKMHRWDKIGKAADLFLAGRRPRAVAKEANINKRTAFVLKKIMVTAGVLDDVCGCGQASGHRGWCAVRLATSPARQAVMSGIHSRRTRRFEASDVVGKAT